MNNYHFLQNAPIRKSNFGLRSITYWLMAITLILLTAGCSFMLLPTDAASAPQSDQPTSNPTVNLTIKDLAEQLGVPVGEIGIEAVEMVTWSDSALGCPEPDMGYMQMLQEGMRVVLQVGDTSYHYHSGGDQDPMLCEEPQEPLTAEPVAGF